MTGCGRDVALDALILAGGRATRLDGFDKAELSIEGSSLLAIALRATDAADARTRVVVGPDRALPASVRRAREDPPFGGPVAAIAAGLAALDPATDDAAGADLVLVLAADMPRAEDAVRLLLTGWSGAGDGAHLVDADGREQWLCGVYRRGPLGAAVAAVSDTSGDIGRGETRGLSVRRLLAPLTLERVDDPDSVAADIDTWSDVESARAKGTP